MKRTLAISLLLTLGAVAFAQTPTVVEKPATKPAPAQKPVPSAKSAKPSPTNVKVVPVAAQKPGSVAVKPAVVKVSPATTTTLPGKPVPAPKAAASKPVVAVPAHPAPLKVASQPAGKGKPVATAKAKPASVSKPKASVQVGKKETPKTQSSPATTTVAVKDNKTANEKKAPIKISQQGRRDPFVSPVVNLGAVGSGCSSGKRCLAIDQIALKGVVKSETGMIAVVVNALDKAYFLRENDPVFNGYVVKITGDSVVFKESYRDRLGKPLTRDVTKTISRPVA